MGRISGGGRNVHGSTSMGTILREKHQIHKYNRSLLTSIMSGTSHLEWAPPSVGRALGSHYAKYATHITLFYQGKIAIIGVHKQIQMSIYPGKGGLTCLLSNVLRKSAFMAALVGNLTCPNFGWPSITGASSHHFQQSTICEKKLFKCKPKNRDCDIFVSGLWLLTILILND